MGYLKNRKYLFVAFLIIIFLINACSKKETGSKLEKSTGKISEEEKVKVKQEVFSFKVEGFDKDRKVQWALEGESANVAGGKININSLKATYYDVDMTLTILADRAVYNKKTQDIELLKNIVGKTSDGGELITDYAKWNAAAEEITTDSYVVVKRQNVVCRGKGLIAKPRLKWVSFKSEIEVDMIPDKKITCKGPFELNQEESVAIFNDSVEILDKDSKTFTDKLTVYLNPETNEVLRIVTEGNVKVVHRGDIEDIGKISL